jgi:hypothetical protein
MMFSKHCHHRVAQLTLDDRRVLATYHKASVAAKRTGISATQIRKACQQLARSAGGYGWRYATNDEAASADASALARARRRHAPVLREKWRRRVARICPLSNTIVEIYPTAHAAATAVFVSDSSIVLACTQQSHRLWLGYKWRYIDANGKIIRTECEPQTPPMSPLTPPMSPCITPPTSDHE